MAAAPSAAFSQRPPLLRSSMLGLTSFLTERPWFYGAQARFGILPGHMGLSRSQGIPLYTSFVGCLAYSYIAFTPWSAALFFIPALAAQRLHVMYREQREAVSELGEANDRLERASLSFATALVATLDARDRYTAGHSAAVAIYSRDIAVRMGLSEREQNLVHLCGLVHDIGKVGLPAGLLEKPGALTLEERRQMEDHPAIGERILSKVEDYAEIARIVRHHHERVDGLGYPRRSQRMTRSHCLPRSSPSRMPTTR